MNGRELSDMFDCKLTLIIIVSHWVFSDGKSVNILTTHDDVDDIKTIFQLYTG